MAIAVKFCAPRSGGKDLRMKPQTILPMAALAALLATSPAGSETLVALGEKAERLVAERKPLFGFTSYVGGGAGGSLIGDTFAPHFRFETGWQITPWFGVASFAAVEPLHDITEIVPQEDAYARRYGSSFSFTPYSRNRFHPLLRISLGGMGIGYTDKSVPTPDDETEFYREKMHFAAGAEVGAEMNLSTHFKAVARAGWKYVDADYLGLDAGDFSRPDLGLEIKASWRTLIY